MDFPRPTQKSWHDGLGAHPFGETLRGIVDQLNVSIYRVSEFSDVDRPYLSRLTSGEKSQPSRKTVLAIGVALVRLGADLLVIDELLATAGQLPVFVIHGIRPMHFSERVFLERTARKHNLNAKKRRKNR